MKITELIPFDLQEESVTRLDSQRLTHHPKNDVSHKALFALFRLKLVLRCTGNLVRHERALLWAR